MGGQHQRVDRPGKGRQTTGRSGDSWFQGHRWCPNDTTGYGIDDDDEIDVETMLILDADTTLILDVDIQC